MLYRHWRQAHLSELKPPQGCLWLANYLGSKLSPYTRVQLDSTLRMLISFKVIQRFRKYLLSEISLRTRMGAIKPKGVAIVYGQGRFFFAE